MRLGGDFSLTTHNTQLQSLRGLAALSVAVGHSAISVDNSTDNFLLLFFRLIFQANTAVVFFFVLSGLVLGSSLRRSAGEAAGPRMIKFALRRVFRLMPVVVASVLVAGAFFYLVGGHAIPAMAPWFDGFFHLPVTWPNILKSFVFLEERINGVLWSIRVELLMIPWLVLFAFVTARTPLAADILLATALWFLPWFLLPPGSGTEFPLFMFCFYLGMVLHKFQNTDAAKMAKRGDLLLLGIVAMVAAEALWLFMGLWLGYKYLIDAIVSAHILAFVMLRPDFPGIRFLHSKLLTALGDVSYSFYAFGFILTVAVYVVIFQSVPMPSSLGHAQATILFVIATALAVGITFAFSIVTFRWIETPGISAAHALTSPKQPGNRDNPGSPSKTLAVGWRQKQR